MAPRTVWLTAPRAGFLIRTTIRQRNVLRSFWVKRILYMIEPAYFTRSEMGDMVQIAFSEKYTRRRTS